MALSRSAEKVVSWWVFQEREKTVLIVRFRLSMALASATLVGVGGAWAGGACTVGGLTGGGSCAGVV